MKVLAAAYLLAVLAGCAAHRDAVRCDGRLQPINPPAPVLTGQAEMPPAAPSETTEARHE